MWAKIDPSFHELPKMMPSAVDVFFLKKRKILLYKEEKTIPSSAFFPYLHNMGNTDRKNIAPEQLVMSSLAHIGCNKSRLPWYYIIIGSISLHFSRRTNK